MANFSYRFGAVLEEFEVRDAIDHAFEHYTNTDNS